MAGSRALGTNPRALGTNPRALGVNPKSLDYVEQVSGTTLTREECRLVSCPECGAGSTYKCSFPGVQDARVRRPSAKLHPKRVEKAKEYRAEHRI